MGRKSVRSDKKLRSRTFSISERHMVLIEAYADVYDLSSSQAIRRLLDIAEQNVDAELRGETNRRRAALSRRIVDVPHTPEARYPTECPNCGDTGNIVRFQDGAWECNLCRTRGVGT